MSSNSSDSSGSSGDESASILSTVSSKSQPLSLRVTPVVEIVASKYLKKGTIIESSLSRRRYEVLECLKRGPLCLIVKLQERNVPVYQKNKVFVLKAECGPLIDEEVGLKCELNILAKAAEVRRLRPATVDTFVELLDRGITDHYRFIITTALGSNLTDLQRTYKGFPMSTAVRINKRMFNAIRNLHSLGYIHRNIQPSNFAVGSQGQAAVVFIIGFSLASRIELDSNGTEILASKPEAPPRRSNTLNPSYMSRKAHSSIAALTRMDDIESWLFSCLAICLSDALPWKKNYIPSESLEMKKNFFYHQYTFEIFFERIPMDYRRIIDIINATSRGSTPDYSKISEINDKLCKQFPTQHKKKATALMDTTRSLMLPTIALITPSSRDKSTNSFYGTPPSIDVFPLKSPKPMITSNVKESPEPPKSPLKGPKSAPPGMLPASSPAVSPVVVTPPIAPSPLGTPPTTSPPTPSTPKKAASNVSPKKNCDKKKPATTSSPVVK